MCLRTLLTMTISLFSSRIILAELGTVDYGIYFAVAGITLVVSFLNSALATSTQRFISLELARQDHERMRAVFSASLQIHLALALLTILVSETLGFWWLNTHMVIPDLRMDAARIAFQYAIFSVALTIVQVPFSAALVAHERFGAYAFFDILHAVLRVAGAALLIVGSGDLLALFSASMFGITLLVMVAKAGYCSLHLASTRYRPCGDRALLRSVGGFAGWSILGAASLVLNIQGIGILLNLFFGPVANAAQNVALQLSNATSTLAANLQITSAPQIIKAYATGESERFHALVEQSARFSFLLMLVLVAPIIVGGEFVLTLWLGSVPADAAAILRLLLLAALVNSLSFPLMTAAQATGTIRLYQIVVSGLMMSVVPIGYLMLTAGTGLPAVFQLLVGLSALALGLRLLLLRRLVRLDIGRFLKAVVWPSVVIGVLTLSVGWSIRMLCADPMVGELAGLMASGITAPVAAFFLGLSPAERMAASRAIRQRLKLAGAHR